MITVGVLVMCSLAPLPVQREVIQLRAQVASCLVTKSTSELVQTVERWSKLPVEDRVRLAELLSRHLLNNKSVRLPDPEDLIIWYRLETGDLTWRGHGLSVRQDVYIVGGRAAWALSRVMGVELPELNEGLTREERQRHVEAILGRVKRFQAEADRKYEGQPIVSCTRSQPDRWDPHTPPDRHQLPSSFSFDDPTSIVHNEAKV